MKTLKRPFLSGVASLLVLFVLSFALRVGGSSGETELVVSFLDVGQGDATLIQSPGGADVLIDGGKNSLVLRGLSKQLGFFDRDIDMVVITHPDLDHIGGLIDVFKKYEVETVLMTENESDTPAYELLKKEIETEGATVMYARRGQKFDLGNGEAGSVLLAVLFPDRDPTHLESNASSIVAQLVYGESEFILSGDSPSGIEEYLVSIGESELRSDVLKVGHHGSKTSTAESFVTAVSPALAIISAGKDNSYGHPHTEVLDTLNARGIPYKNTADVGSIVVVSDGETIWIR